MKNSPSFVQPVIKAFKSQIDTPYWDKVLDLYDEKKYQEALLGVLRYINPKILEEKANTDKTKFSIPHGSIIVDIEIIEGQFKVKAPFLQIPDNPVPLFRQVAQLNFSPLNLVNIKLYDKQLVFEYNCPIELCEPYKIYEVLREICIYADSYDDEFISKFGAKHITEPEVQNFTDETNEKVYQQIQKDIKQAEEFIQYFEEKRIYGFAWDIITITLLKIDHYCAPQGYLRSEIEKEISYMQKSNDNLNEKVNKGKTFLNRLKDWNKEELFDDLYTADVFVPFKSSYNSEAIKNRFAKGYDRAKNEMDRGDNMGATFTLIYEYVSLLYYCQVSEKYQIEITNALLQSSNKPWHDAAKALWKSINRIMNDQVVLQKSKSTKKKGFFASLFGK